MSNEPHVRIEYDPEFQGGDYEGVGSYAYVPESAASEPGGVEAAFEAKTGYPASCIVFFTVDELYDKIGATLQETPAP
jgi:hypothetical protein